MQEFIKIGNPPVVTQPGDFSEQHRVTIPDVIAFPLFAGNQSLRRVRNDVFIPPFQEFPADNRVTVDIRRDDVFYKSEIKHMVYGITGAVRSERAHENLPSSQSTAVYFRRFYL